MVPLPPLPPSDAEPAGEDALLEAALGELEPYALPDAFVADVMANLPARRRNTALPAVAKVAAAVLLAVGITLAVQGLSPTVARAEAPALLENTLAPVAAALPQPVLDTEILPRAPAGEGATIAALTLLGTAILLGGLALARRLLGAAPPPTRTRTPTEVSR